ncbi:short-chain dehydrogenase TIC 32, chloroplastic-like [Salvia miltiorrhiza]|uniref:short-chain dehydrogenase TIC 32, chloroplastic-like n=1 Tax=Salvia miltiorrhiza TaxID=226208 RepID=UPI0025AC1E33|nr:short-chain dehydrogenase TIC 32, chloroplastic-like [Salvia miltiorrhiza]XP_057809288.1 short-chain dehydrogenase TIC 32, chloroplastic-like [Salvia miltiorrhiza]XP_057809289.1 short-chain dehydrogenase TIC 32, chloroplastic-like [Salvia miltiorrhiza]
MMAALKYLAGIVGPSGYGSKTTAQQVADDCFSSMPSSHLTAIVTGATSGIGKETARVLAKGGVRVVIPAMDLREGEGVKESIQKESPEAEIIILELNLSSFASIKRFCSHFLSLGLPLHILINNAGIMSRQLEFSEDQIELTFATNYLGHFVLTEMLVGKMVETAAESCIEGRIVNVSSASHSWVDSKHFCFNELLHPKSYSIMKAYAQSKLAIILHARELSRQLKAKEANVTINAVHPGSIGTGIVKDFKVLHLLSGFLGSMLSKFLKSIPQGAATTCYVALSPRLAGVSGAYFADCNESHCSALASDDNIARSLWKQTHQLINNWEGKESQN